MRAVAPSRAVLLLSALIDTCTGAVLVVVCATIAAADTVLVARGRALSFEDRVPPHAAGVLSDVMALFALFAAALVSLAVLTLGYLVGEIVFLVCVVVPLEVIVWVCEALRFPGPRHAHAH